MDSEILSLSDSISPASAQSYKLSHQGCVRLVTYQRDNEICILGCFNMELGSRMMAESGGGLHKWKETSQYTRSPDTYSAT